MDGTLERALTEQRPTEEALRESEARLAGILAIAADAIITIDGQQRIALFNTGAEAMFGYGRAEVIGQSLDILLPERFRLGHKAHISAFCGSAATARRMGERQQVYGLRKSGVEFPAEASIAKLDFGGRRTFTVISLTPSSAAICLFSMPLIASVSTSCSRGVRERWRCFRA